jgi:hypothetical protein
VTDPPRIIASFNDYASMISGIRERVNELQVPLELLDDISGLPTRYVSKLLGPAQVRRFSMQSLAPLLGALGLKCLFVEDAEAIARFGGRLRKRDRTAIRSSSVEFRFSRQFMREIQEKGRKARFDKMTPQQRSALARKLNRIRWGRVKSGSGAGR